MLGVTTRSGARGFAIVVPRRWHDSVPGYELVG